MNTQSSSSVSSTTATPLLPKGIQTNNRDPSKLVTINEKVNLTKKQNEVLQMICNSYEMTISEYMQQALVEAMRFDIEEGNFSDVLLQKITDRKDEERNKRSINKEKSRSPFFTGSSVHKNLDADLQF
jgi:hypothetical protein